MMPNMVGPGRRGGGSTVGGSQGEPDYAAVPNWAEFGNGITTGNIALDSTHGLWESFDRYASVATMRDASTYGTYGLHSQPRGDGANAAYSLITGRSGAGQAFRITYSVTGSQLAPSLTLPWRNGDQDDMYPLPHTNYTLDGTTSLVVQWWWRISADIVNGGWWKWMMNWYHEDAAKRTESSNYQNRSAWNHGYWDNIPVTCHVIHPYFTDLIDGQWHRQTNVFRGNTTWTNTDPPGLSARNGRAATFLDGYKVVDMQQSTFGVTPDTTVWGAPLRTWTDQDWVDDIPARTVEYIRWPGDMLSVVNAGTLDFDDVRIWVI